MYKAPENWFWKHKETGRVYSSAAKSYINDDNPEYRNFLAAGLMPYPFPVDGTPERREAEEELFRVLAFYGILPGGGK